ncbi:restriction endonuclease subunit S [Sphaerimonospora thailandensis]|uniref:Type I restriction modification DNA specificity domain-containing protein n=1 Tax=Sphaerimonospora thailandensis TaxID=795644 RepID=A0A8J3R6E7_9ACTN|nr:restriction endonuclease subunit S [Sphaerimonospora thailandensis]GIH69235.1 hypothetical protein Mth01_14880 [Sphaerimonospora thailandensis]
MSDFTEMTIGELASRGYLEFGDGYRTKATEYGQPGLPILRVAEVLDGEIVPGGSDFIRDEYRTVIGSKISRLGDVVLTTKGTVGRVAVISDDHVGFAYSPQVCYFRTSPNPIISSRYLYFWFRSEYFRRQAAAFKGQTDMADYLNLSDIKSLRVSLPSRRRQDAACSVLGVLEKKMTVNGHIASTSLGLAAIGFSAVMQKDQSTVTLTIGEAADVFDGPHATPTKTEDGPWFLSISSLENGLLKLTESAHLSEDDFVKWTRRVTPAAGDVLFSYETRLGAAALMPPGVRGCLGRRMALMRVRHGAIQPELLLHAFLGREFQETIQRRAIHGATVDRIPLKELPSWPIRLPREGRREQLAKLLRSLHNNIFRAQRENQTLAELRDALLPKLISGEIRIKDAEGLVEGMV